jgi:hypothetical protein
MLQLEVCCCAVQVYRGTWTNIDIAAKEYVAVEDIEVEEGRWQPSEVALQRARVRLAARSSEHHSKSCTPAWFCS